MNLAHETVFRVWKIIIGEMRYYFDGGRRKRKDTLDLRLRRKIVVRNAVIGLERRDDGGREIELDRGYFRVMMSV